MEGIWQENDQFWTLDIDNDINVFPTQHVNATSFWAAIQDVQAWTHLKEKLS